VEENKRRTRRRKVAGRGWKGGEQWEGAREGKRVRLRWWAKMSCPATA
jgi:hypothetical protein